MAEEKKRPLILVTNDDGIDAKGLALLAEEMHTLGEVYVVAPATGQSAMSKALTTQLPLRATEVEKGTPYRQFAVTGTPTDCVKLAVAVLLPRRPDLVVAGINHGSNVSIAVLYSGTLGAALEGSISGVPSIGFSQKGRKSDMTPCLPYVRRIASETLTHGLANGTCLNVNFPEGELQGVRLCRQTRAMYLNKFDTREHPDGGEYHWLRDSFTNLEPEAEDTDSWAMRHGYVSVVPVKIDLTDYETLESLSAWRWEP